MRTRPALAWRAAVPALVLTLAGSCSTQTYPTPSRNLDRPSDAAVMCVEYEVPPDGAETCLPPAALATSDPAEYLAQYCGNSKWRELRPLAKVLPIGDCDDGKLRQRRDSYYAPLRQVAAVLGRNPNAPCCTDVDAESCDEQNRAPVCVRRTLMTLIANTARGELALGDTAGQTPGLTTVGRLTNLHGGAPGFGFLPVGLQPEHVRAHATGTWAVTSNAGSCDLSVVALDKVVQLTARPANCDDKGQVCPSADCDGASCPQRVEPWLPGGPANKLRARPAWIEIAPWAGSLSQSAAVAYPTCGVVAVVKLSADPMTGEPAGKVLEAIAFDQQDPRVLPKRLSSTELAALRCPIDCGGETGMQMPDPNQLPMGGLMRSAAYPATLAFDAEGHRLLIGDPARDSLTVVDFDPGAPEGSRLQPMLRSIPLDFETRSEAPRGGQRGVNVVRVGPRSAAGLYAYAVARDSSVRVIDLDRELECETNPDPRFVRQQGAGPLGPLRVLPDDYNDSNLRRLGCLPVDKVKTPRSPLATGPGISLPNGSTPRDIGFAHSDVLACTSTNLEECPFTTSNPDYFLRASASLWVGDFAWILGGAGSVLGLQIADACPSPSSRVCSPEAAAQQRAVLLHTRSQALPSPEQLSLPGLPAALTVSPLDRLGNVRRVYSRFDDLSTTGPGPRTDIDVATGLPVFTARISGTQTTVLRLLSEDNTTRRRLELPAPAPYYYLPVDPVCDVALEEQVSHRSAPDTGLSDEPRRRPVALASFTDPGAVVSERWSLEWEGLLNNSLSRATGRILSDGTLVDVNGLYCARGVESGDKLWLTGCVSNSECFDGTTCRRGSQSNAPGLCLTNDQEAKCRDLSSRLLATTDSSGALVPDSTIWAADWYRRYLVTQAAQQVPAADGSRELLDRLSLNELYEPEFELERESCTNTGDRCSQIPVRPPSSTGNAPRVLATPICHITGGTQAAPVRSCVLECDADRKCGEGFVCARSRYDEWEAPGTAKRRCVRAPLLAPGTGWLAGGRFVPMSAGDVQQVIAACFPDQARYEVRVGDAFLVRGSQTASPSAMRRRQDPMNPARDGVCERPQPGDATYLSSRLFQPRLRTGPRTSLADTDTRRCPATDTSWLPHRWAPAQESTAAPSCQRLFSPPGGAPNRLQLPNVLSENQPTIRHGATYLPPTEVECAARPTDPRCQDPWLRREYELFGSLQLDAAANQCVLTGAVEETYPMKAACGPGLCLFPGDHSEVLGVRRIHFENAYGNLVMRLPRDLQFPDQWVVPPEGYAVDFGVVGAQIPYVQLAQTSQRDGLSDVLAQGLRAAVTAPSGVVYLVDEGRTGVSTYLRGRVIRAVGSAIDPYFILR